MSKKIILTLMSVGLVNSYAAEFEEMRFRPVDTTLVNFTTSDGTQINRDSVIAFLRNKYNNQDNQLITDLEENLESFYPNTLNGKKTIIKQINSVINRHPKDGGVVELFAATKGYSSDDWENLVKAKKDLHAALGLGAAQPFHK